jgi:hypothetical protein
MRRSTPTRAVEPLEEEKVGPVHVMKAYRVVEGIDLPIFNPAI